MLSSCKDLVAVTVTFTCARNLCSNFLEVNVEKPVPGEGNITVLMFLPSFCYFIGKAEFFILDQFSKIYCACGP